MIENTELGSLVPIFFDHLSSQACKKSSFPRHHTFSSELGKYDLSVCYRNQHWCVQKGKTNGYLL